MMTKIFNKKWLFLFTIILAALELSIIQFQITSMMSIRKQSDEIRENVNNINEKALKDILLNQTTKDLRTIQNYWFAHELTPHVDDFLRYNATHIRGYGDNATSIIFDFKTKNILMNKGELLIEKDLSSIPTIFNVNSTPCLNYGAYKSYLNDIVNVSDVLGTSYLVNLYNEPNISYGDAKKFDKYPLGEYNREFIQKIIVPFPDSPQDEFVIVVGIQEREINMNFENIKNNILEIEECRLKHINELISLNIVGILFCLLLSAFANVVILKSCK